MNDCENCLPNLRYIEFDLPGDEEPVPQDTIQEEVFPELEVPIENVTVKFRVSETAVIAQIYPNYLTILEIKKDIAEKFEVDPKQLSMKLCNRELSDECVLLETDRDAFGIYEFVLDLKELKRPTDDSDDEDYIKPKLDLNIYYAKYRLPDFIIVHIAAEDSLDGIAKNIVVEIQNKAIVKPFLCGYRNKTTGVEYLDAFTQTGPYFDKWKHRRYYSRDTQTYEHKEKLIDTMHDQTTQCWQDGNNIRFVSEALDFTITAKKYQTHAHKVRLENKLAKIILIQRNWKRFLIVRFMKNAAREYRRLVANRIEEEDKFKTEVERRMQREARAKQFPRTKDDFELLYGEVEKWKMAEMKRIVSMYEGPARIAEINILLDKEIQMLSGIDRQRTVVFKAMKDFRDEQLLKKMGEPIRWVGYKDKVVHCDLLRTQRVRFLTEIYKDMQKRIDKKERLVLLHKIKEILIQNEQDFPSFPELVDLIQREINLLLHTQYCDVEVLRKQENLLFMELIKFSKDKPPEKIGQRMCEVCKQVKPFDQFALRTRQNKVDTCKRCFYLKIASLDNTVYTSILRAIQREERKKRCNASFAFVMQLDDIRHIIDQIWHGHSILSKNENINCLRLPRWIKSEDWSPWNCVCLTESEARDHYRVENLEKVYDYKMILEIGNRHMLARSAFHKLAAVATEFLETGQWWNVGLNKQRLAMPKNNSTTKNDLGKK